MPRKTSYPIHITDVGRFKSCRRAWSFASPLRHNLTPKQRYAPFFVGTLVHKGLELYYSGLHSFGAAFKQYVAEQLGKYPANPLDEGYSEVALVNAMIDHYVLWQRYDQGAYRDANFEFIALERVFTYRLWSNSRREVVLSGRFDGIVRHKLTNRYYLWEIKTTRSITERQKQLELDPQADAYLIAAGKVLRHDLGIDADISGIVYTLLRKKIPSTPDVLTNGLLSKKKIDTSAPWYLSAARAHHGADATREFLAANYGDHLDGLIADANPFFARVIVNRTLAELGTAYEQLVGVAQEMIDPKLSLYPNPTPACNYCIYRDPCLLMQRGQMSAATQLLAANYELNRAYSDEVPHGEAD